MKNLIFSILAPILLCVFGNSAARADIYIEPFIGYETIKSGDDKGSGTAYGGRFGYKSMGFAIGGQYDVFSSTVKTSDSTGTKNFDLTGSNYGVFFSYELPVLIRLWATYYLSSKATLKNYSVDPDGSGSIEAVLGDTTYKGSGTEFGLGFTGIPIVNINFSVANFKYDNNSHPVLEDYPTATVADTNSTVYMLSLSVPISF